MRYGTGLYGVDDYEGPVVPNELKRFSAEPLILVQFDFATGTKYIAQAHLRFDSAHYEGRLLSLGQIRRVTQKNLGLYEVTAIDIQVADVDQVFSKVTEPIKGTPVEIKVGVAGAALCDYRTVIKGQIDDYSISEFTISFVIKDSMIVLPEFPKTGTVNETDFPNCPNDSRGLPLPVVYGTHSVTDGDAMMDDWRNRGAWPTIYVDNQSNAKTFLVACHAVADITKVYANRNSDGSNELTLGTDYTIQEAGTLAGRTMAWVQFTDSQFLANIAEPTGGGIGQVRVNVIGKETSGVGVGSAITNPIDVIADFLSNYLGVTNFDTTSLIGVRDICSARTYTTAGGYSEQKQTSVVLTEFCRSFNLQLFTTRLGDVGFHMVDPEAFNAIGFDYREDRDILQGSWSIDRASEIEGAEDSQIVNLIHYTFQYHHAIAKFVRSQEQRDTNSVGIYGEKVLDLEMPWAGDAATAADVVTRIIIQFKAIVPHATFKVGLRGLLADLGDKALLNHDNGSAGIPWTDRPCEIVAHTLDPNEFVVTMRARDLSTIYDAAFFLDDETLRQRNTGTATVASGSGNVDVTGGTSGVQIGDILRLISPTNEGNRLSTKVTGIVDADTVTVANTIWTNESGIAYDIIPSWLTASAAQALCGHVCDGASAEFSNGTAGKTLL